MSGAPAGSAKVPWKSKAAATIILLIVRLLGATCRVRVSGDRDAFLELPERDQAVVLALWHNRLITFAPFVVARLMPRGFKLAVLASNSKDGEIGSMVAQRVGAMIVRGSSSSNGSAGLRALYRAITKQNHSIVLLPDGSQGPVYKAKAGAVALASMAGVPILPISTWASAYWRIKSWDRMLIPKPFARIEIVVGKPIHVARSEGGDTTMESARLELEKTLDSLGFEAEKAFGRGPLAKASS